MDVRRDADAALRIAVRAVHEPLANGGRWRPAMAELTRSLAAPGACFVTVRRDEVLLGCIGSLRPRQALGLDIADNAAAAAFDDPRLPPVVTHDLPHLHVHISVLSALEPMAVTSRRELDDSVRPGVDGVLIDDGRHRATLLPSVWSQLPHSREFLDALWRKAGLPAAAWPASLEVSRYQVVEISGRATDYEVPVPRRR